MNKNTKRKFFWKRTLILSAIMNIGIPIILYCFLQLHPGSKDSFKELFIAATFCSFTLIYIPLFFMWVGNGWKKELTIETGDSQNTNHASNEDANNCYQNLDDAYFSFENNSDFDSFLNTLQNKINFYKKMRKK